MSSTAQPCHPPVDDQLARELMELGCGRSLGRYTLLRKIATGGMAEVFAARSRGVSGYEKKVAIKRILPQHAHNQKFLEMLVDEAKISASLAHPNIAQLYELAVAGENSYFLVMELVDGPPLSRVLSRLRELGRKMPVEIAAHIISEVAKGLDHAHKQTDARGASLQIVHRDVSPQNILLSQAGDVKLIDFGIARAEGRAARTGQGVIKGKLKYLAPEIANGDDPDHRADVYCCGLVLFEILAGEPMFTPATDLEAIETAREARVRSPRAINPAVPESLEDIVMRALRRDRNARYQSAKELHLELRAFLSRAHPDFIGSELADLISVIFASEIREVRHIDAAAESLARAIEQEASAQTFVRPEPDTIEPGTIERGTFQPASFDAELFETDSADPESLDPGPFGDVGSSLHVLSDDGGAAAVRSVEVDDVALARAAIQELAERQTKPHEPSPWRVLAVGGAAATADAEIRDTEACAPILEADSMPSALGMLDTYDIPAQFPGDEPTLDAGIEEVEALLPTKKRNRRLESEAPATTVSPPPEPSEEVEIESGELRAGLASNTAVDPAHDTLLPDAEREFHTEITQLGTAESRAAPSGFVDAPIEESARQPAQPPPPPPASLIGVEPPAFATEVRVESPRPVRVVRKETVPRGRSRSSFGNLTLMLAAFAVGGSSIALALTLEAGSSTVVILPTGTHGQTASATIAVAPVVVAPPPAVEAPPAPPPPPEPVVEEEEPAPSKKEKPSRASQGSLRIQSTPGSQIIVDGKRRGKAPRTLSLKPGMHEIVVESPSGEKRKVARYVSRGKNQPIVINW